MYISSRVDEKERSYKVAVCIYYHMFIKRKKNYKGVECTYHYLLIKRKEVIKVRYVYIIKCSLKGKKL